ncbi:MAG: hypothetical protein CVU34_04315 [Betaproteobacteria bacterium HGW-Betaproteobacteria-7]|jgi:hypothetical protein|nr:MAG: hypothetical protein CVU34_04315 [Betaproteobacteria bacterium HGW-Betaproteobacteria-7]
MTKSGFLATLATALASALLPACDIVNLPQIKPGITTATEVLERMGEPGFRHWNDDGTATWEYSRQPAGVHCYMISFDRQQVVARLEQVLGDEYYARVRPGMSKDDIRRLLGTPGSRTMFDNLREEIWEWRIESLLPSEETYFMVHFDTAHGAVKKSSKRTEPKA